MKEGMVGGEHQFLQKKNKKKRENSLVGEGPKEMKEELTDSE